MSQDSFVSLESLVGVHTLTGVDTDPRESPLRHADAISFMLDGQTYLAVEDPQDDYRSSMESISRVDEPTKNQFPVVQVLGRMRDNDPVLELLNVETGKVILSVGTDNADDYYPCWVAAYHPENL